MDCRMAIAGCGTSHLSLLPFLIPPTPYSSLLTPNFSLLHTCRPATRFTKLVEHFPCSRLGDIRPGKLLTDSTRNGLGHFHRGVMATHVIRFHLAFLNHICHRLFDSLGLFRFP